MPLKFCIDVVGAQDANSPQLSSVTELRMLTAWACYLSALEKYARLCMLVHVPEKLCSFTRDAKRCTDNWIRARGKVQLCVPTLLTAVVTSSGSWKSWARRVILRGGQLGTTDHVCKLLDDQSAQNRLQHGIYRQLPRTGTDDALSEGRSRALGAHCVPDGSLAELAFWILFVHPSASVWGVHVCPGWQAAADRGASQKHPI